MKIIRYIKMKIKKKLKRGVCRECGCTENNACYVNGIGACWWVNNTKTLCSHCFYNFYENGLEEIEKEKIL